MRLLIWAAVAVCAYAYDRDTQFVKSVKGGHSNSQYRGDDISRFYDNKTVYRGGYNNTSTYGGAGGGPVKTPIDFEVGVCYIEVPTSTLVRDQVHIPAGNGSRPDLSRIRTCCKGYARNVYNFRICEPVCQDECVNGLCSAPDTCTCYPDHVRNLKGICVATCPIGCQNGVCQGGECMCREGYKLDVSRKFCVPNCRHNCGGIGNCTAPNTCECQPGYQTTSDGMCTVGCGKCDNGDCISPNECRCRVGYIKNSQGICAPHCQNCEPYGRCIAPNNCVPLNNTATPGQVPTHGIPQQPNSQNPYGLGQNNTFYYNPSQGSNNPLYPYNQVDAKYQNQSNPNYRPNNSQQNPSYPNQGSNSPYPNNNPNQGSNYPQPNPSNPNQGSNYPQPNPYNPNPGSNYHQPNPTNPTQGSNHPNYNPNYPNQGSSYPHPNPSYVYQRPNYDANQPQGPGYSQPNPIYHQQGYYNPQDNQHPQGNTFNQGNQYPINPNPNQPNQGSFAVESVNLYPLYTDNKLGSNETRSPNQPEHNYPGVQRPYPDQGSYPQYPNPGQNQANRWYPTNQHGYYPYDQDQNTYDQSQNTFPVCSEPCVNAMCIDHNRCRCNPGYVTDESDPSGNRCRPHCPGGCPNGFCVAPHSCACDDGYYKDTSIKGRAVCIKRIRRSLRDLVFNEKQ